MVNPLLEIGIIHFLAFAGEREEEEEEEGLGFRSGCSWRINNVSHMYI